MDISSKHNIAQQAVQHYRPVSVFLFANDIPFFRTPRQPVTLLRTLMIWLKNINDGLFKKRIVITTTPNTSKFRHETAKNTPKGLKLETFSPTRDNSQRQNKTKSRSERNKNATRVSFTNLINKWTWNLRISRIRAWKYQLLCTSRALNKKEGRGENENKIH